MPSTLNTTYDIIFGDFVEPDFSRVLVQHQEARGARNKQDKIADLLGIDRLEPIKPTLDQLEAAKVKLESATDEDSKVRIQSDIVRLTAKSEKVQKDHKAFEDNQPALQDFLATYSTSPSLGRYLFGENFALKPKAEQDIRDAQIQAMFHNNEVQGYFDEHNPQHQELYKACYIMCMHRAQFVENTKLDEVEESAYKMMALFSPPVQQLQDDVRANAGATFRKGDYFISSHVKSAQAVHDICLNRLPDYNVDEELLFNLDGWKEKLPILGMKLVQNFSDIQKIEQIITQRSKADTAIIKVGVDNLPIDIASFDEALKRISYSRLEENPKLASVFKLHKAPEAMFNRALDLMKDGILNTDASKTHLLPKEVDNLPDLCIKVPGTEDIYMAKFPAHNPRSLILGDITNCCQSISGNSEGCVVEGVNLPNNGFYVFLKANKKNFDPKNIDWDNLEAAGNKIIGQSYSWLGIDNALILDSLEVLGSFRNQINVEAMMQEFGRVVSTIDPSISRIMVGMGGGTQSVLEEAPNNTNRLQQAISNTYMREGNQYGDSSEQYEVYTSGSLIKLREELKGKMKDVNIITSDKQAALLSTLTKAELSELEKYPNMLSHPLVTSYENADSLKAFYQAFNQYSDQQKEILSRNNVIVGWLKKYYSFDDLAQTEVSKLDCLTSFGAFKMYNTHPELFDEFKEIEVEKIHALLTPGCVELYEMHPEIFNELKKMEPKWVTALASDSLVALYQKNPEVFHVIKDMNLDKAQALGHWAFSGLFFSNPEAFEDLKAMSAKEINMLTGSHHLEKLYASHREIFLKLKTIPNIQNIYSLTCESAIALYDKYPNAFEELKKMESGKLSILLTPHAQKIYAQNPLAFDALKNMELGKLSILLSPEAQKIYKQYPLAFENLKKMDAPKIAHLMCPKAVALYNKHPEVFEDLRGMDIQMIHCFLYSVPLEFYDQPLNIFQELKTINLSKIRMLMSDNARVLYEKSPEALNALKNMESDKVWILTSELFSKYNPKYVEEFDEFKVMDLPKLQALTSYAFKELFLAHPEAFNELKNMDVSKIQALNSSYALKLYDMDPKTFNKFNGMELEKIKALASFSLEKFYDNHPGAFNELKEMELEKSKALTSFSLEKFYDKHPGSFNDLKKMELEKIKALTLYALEFYDNHPGAFNDLKKMDIPKIKELTSLSLVQFCDKYPDTFKDLKKMDIPQIKVLTSYHLEALYDKHPEMFNILKNVDDIEKLKLLTGEAVRMYMHEPEALERLIHLSTENISKLIGASFWKTLDERAKELGITLGPKPDATDRLHLEVEKIANGELAQHVHHDVTEVQNSHHTKDQDLRNIGKVLNAAGASSTLVAETTRTSRPGSPVRGAQKDGVNKV